MLRYLDKIACLAAIGLLGWFVYADIRDVRELSDSSENLNSVIGRMEDVIEANKDGFPVEPMESARVSDRTVSPWRDAGSSGSLHRNDFYPMR